MMILLLVAAIVPTESPDPAKIPARERIAYVNKLMDRFDGPNAAPHYTQAIEAYQYVFILRTELGSGKQDKRLAAALESLDYYGREFALSRRWTKPQRQAVDAYLEANADTLGAIIRATDLTRCFIPFQHESHRLCNVSGLIDSWPGFALSKLTRTKANARAIADDWDEAYDWNARAHRAAFHRAQSPFFLDRLSAQHEEHESLDQFIAFLRRSYPEDARDRLMRFEQDRRLDVTEAIIDATSAVWNRDWVEAWHEWADHPNRHPALTETADNMFAMFNGDGILGAELSKLLVNDRYKSRTELRTAIQSTTVAHDWATLGTLNELVDAWWKTPFHEAWAGLITYETAYCSIQRESPLWSAWGCNTFETHRAREMDAATAARRAAVACIVALHEFKKKNDQFPDSLAELTPKFLAEPAIDPFSGKPLVYQPKSDGSDFTLYSVGRNLKDDHGKRANALVEDKGDHVFWPPKPPKIKRD